MKNRYFDWYNERILEEALDEIEEEVTEAKSISPDEYDLSKYSFPVFMDKHAVILSGLTKYDFLAERATG